MTESSMPTRHDLDSDSMHDGRLRFACRLIAAGLTGVLLPLFRDFGRSLGIPVGTATTVYFALNYVCLMFICWPLQKYRLAVLVSLVAGTGFTLIGMRTFLRAWRMGFIPDLFSVVLAIPKAFVFACVFNCLLLCLAVRIRNHYWPVHSEGHCKNCGYCLYGLATGRCPECGTCVETEDTQNDAQT